MEQFKRAKVVMLPTNEKTNIINTNQGLLYNSNDYIGINQHLYIISDDEIKEGNYYIIDDIPELLKNNGLKFIDDYCKKVIATTDTSLYTHQKETVSLPERVFYLPHPSQQFIQKYIEEYNKGNVITAVLVDYEQDYTNRNCNTCNLGTNSTCELGLEKECCSNTKDDINHKDYWISCLEGEKDSETYKLKINSKNNTITIKKLKEVYTKEELSQILENFTSFLWSEVGIHYPISLGNDAREKFINNEL